MNQIASSVPAAAPAGPNHAAGGAGGPSRAARPNRGSTLLTLLIGIILGLGIAVLTAFTVNHASIPFLNQGVKRPDRPAVTAGTEAQAGRADPEALPDPNRTAGALRPRPQPGAQPVQRNEVATVNSPGLSPDATAGTAPSGATVPPLPPPSVITPRGDADPSARAGGNAPIRSASPTVVAGASPGSTLLPGGSPAVAGLPSGAATAPGVPGQAATPVSSYLLQAGAFRNPAEADAMRGRLLMLGYEATVGQADVNGQNVFRVRVGPFAGLDAMNRARTRLADNGVDATVLRQR